MEIVSSKNKGSLKKRAYDRMGPKRPKKKVLLLKATVLV
jgi:hypothetical protein